MGSERNVEIHIPSVLGAEKDAMEKAAAVAREMGFSENRVEDLKTAVAEACTNAIEHGNKLDAETKVAVVMTVGDGRLEIAVHDRGKGFGPSAAPDVVRKVEGEEPKRGWGRFLIERLTDAVTMETAPHGGNVVTMVIFPEKEGSP